MEQILHLFITNKCRHNCKLCCNKFYKIDEIPVVTVELLKTVDTVCLTGGEPLGINHNIFENFVISLRNQYNNIKNLYVYTSGKELEDAISSSLGHLIPDYINGINVAPKDFEDWYAFAKLVTYGSNCLLGKPFAVRNYNTISHRLYVFEEQYPIYEALKLNLSGLHINVINRKWDKVFNTPDNEHFARIPILF